MEELRMVDIEECSQIIGALMLWIQDMNWPIAQEMICILLRFREKLLPHIKDVFMSDDEMWKYWTLDLVNKLPYETAIELKNDIARLAYHPSEKEKNEEVDIKAKELLNLLSG